MAPRLPPLGDLQAFMLVGETRSLTRAAELFQHPATGDVGKGGEGGVETGVGILNHMVQF
mgnify:CR=1 FL=1